MCSGRAAAAPHFRPPRTLRTTLPSSFRTNRSSGPGTPIYLARLASAPSPSSMAAAAGRRTLARATRSDSSADVRAAALPQEPRSSKRERQGEREARRRASAQKGPCERAASPRVPSRLAQRRWISTAAPSRPATSQRLAADPRAELEPARRRTDPLLLEKDVVSAGSRALLR